MIKLSLKGCLSGIRVLEVPRILDRRTRRSVVGRTMTKKKASARHHINNHTLMVPRRAMAMPPKVARTTTFTHSRRRRHRLRGLVCSLRIHPLSTRSQTTTITKTISINIIHAISTTMLIIVILVTINRINIININSNSNNRMALVTRHRCRASHGVIHHPRTTAKDTPMGIPMDIRMASPTDILTFGQAIRLETMSHLKAIGTRGSSLRTWLTEKVM